MAKDNEFKVSVEELTAVANGIRILLGQNIQTNPYNWTDDYTTNLAQIRSILNSLSEVIGDGDGTYDSGLTQSLQDKIEEVQDRLNEIIDPDHSQTDEPVFDAIEDIENLVNSLDDILDDDPSDPNQSLEDIVNDYVEQIDILEEVVDPAGNTPGIIDQPFEDTVSEIKDAIDDIRETVPDPDAEPGDPDGRTIEEVAEDVADAINEKNEFEQLLRDIEEIIHQGAVYTGEEDPITYYYVVVDGEWESIPEEEIDPSIYTEEEEIAFQPSDGDEAGEDYNEYTAYSFTESQKSVDDYFDTKADEIYELMEDQDLEWEDLTDNQKLIIIFDDLLDYIESLEAEVDEYRNGGFQLIETSSAVSGSGIFDTIQNLETARRETMTPEQKEEEKTVVYISRCLFNTTESFICTGLIDGVRKNGAFFYRDSTTNNFYNTSAPTSNAKLGAGKYLIRVILREEAYFNAEI